MHPNVLGQIEEMSHNLSKQEMLWLIDQFIHRLRDGLGESKAANFKNQLSIMAKDPEIQMELKKINCEFGVTESDGLGVK